MAERSGRLTPLRFVILPQSVLPRIVLRKKYGDKIDTQP